MGNVQKLGQLVVVEFTHSIDAGIKWNNEFSGTYLTLRVHFALLLYIILELTKFNLTQLISNFS